MLTKMLLVGIGGFAGSMLRYVCQYALNTSFPYGTLLVNIAGCFVIGCLWALVLRGLNDQWALLLMSGVCGGFTTFSAFTLEGVQLLINHRYLTFTLYTTISVLAGLLFTFLGFKILNS
jgi:CrcB protein